MMDENCYTTQIGEITFSCEHQLVSPYARIPV